MFISDFITYEGDRFFVSADLRTRKIRIERVSNETFETFIRSILTMDDPIEIEAGKKEVSA